MSGNICCISDTSMDMSSFCVRKVRRVSSNLIKHLQASGIVKELIAQQKRAEASKRWKLFSATFLGSQLVTIATPARFQGVECSLARRHVFRLSGIRAQATLLSHCLAELVSAARASGLGKCESKHRL